MKFKNSKGITLVALVITIILLLLLAAITISSLRNSGLFSGAKNAKLKTEIAQEKEEWNFNKKYFRVGLLFH